MIRTPAQLDAEAQRIAGRGLRAAASHLANCFKEVLSVPAPRRRVQSRTGEVYYRATTPASPGAPPRKLSGRLRAAQTRQTVSPTRERVGSNVAYARRHERGDHPFMLPTLAREVPRLAAIIGAG
jgi:hypothetical protein